MVIKNVFFHGDLEEEIYMEQPPNFVAQEEGVLDCKYTNLSMILNYLCMLGLTYRSIFYCHVCHKKCVYHLCILMTQSLHIMRPLKFLSQRTFMQSLLDKRSWMF